MIAGVGQSARGSRLAAETHAGVGLFLGGRELAGANHLDGDGTAKMA
jgi:hypothetical protein